MWISREKFEILKSKVRELELTLDAISNQAILKDIDRRGRITIFTFIRNDKIIKIETMSLISDNMLQWKNDLLR